MTVKFTLHIGPFSVNSTHYRDKRHKTAKFKEWELVVDEMLLKIPQLTELADKWRIFGGEFAVHMRTVYPLDTFYNNQGVVSARTMDLSNVEKPLLDRVFLQRLKVDDRFVTELHSTKAPGDALYMEIKIQLLPERQRIGQ